MENQTTDQLVAMYGSNGWKHFENWIQGQIQDAVLEIMNPETPSEDVGNLRMVAYTYQSILDKAIADKEQLKQMKAQKE
jgi:hypothetical protein